MEQYEYELIDIEWCLNYDLSFDAPTRMVKDGDDVSKEQKTPIEYDEEGIPMGSTQEEIEKRRQIIHERIQQWRILHKDNPYIYNDELGENIKISQVFLLESVAHSAVRYLSTKAVLQLETVIAQAKEVGLSKVKQTTDNQKPFVRMIVMIFKSNEIGNVKLTVGIRKRTEEKVGYNITVPSPGTAFLEKEMRVNAGSKKKKASHKK